MASKRQQLPDTIIQPAALNPQAGGGDTYYQPSMKPVAKPAESNSLINLGKALESIQPSLQQWTNKTLDYVSEKEFRKGALAAAENKLSFKEATEAGLISPGFNPWFKNGFNDQRLRVRAQEYDTAIRVNFNQSGYLDKDDVTSYFTDYRTRLYEDLQKEGIRPEQIQAVVTPMVNASEKTLATHHATERAKRIESQALINTGSETLKQMDDYWIGKKIGATDADFSASATTVGTQWSAVIQGHESNGMDKNKLANAVFETTLARALKDQDPNAFRVLMETKLSDGVPIGRYPDIEAKVERAKQEIRRNVQTANYNSHWELEEQRKSSINNVLRDFYIGKKTDDKGNPKPYTLADAKRDIIAIDPSKVSYLDRAEDREYTTKERAFKEQNEVQNSTHNRQVYANLRKMARTKQGGFDDALENAISNNNITRTEYEELVGFAESVNNDLGLNDPVIKSVISDINLTPAFLRGTKASGLYADKTEKAKDEVTQGLIDFKAENPQATKSQMYAKARELKKTIVDFYTEDTVERPSQKPATGSKPSSGTSKPATSKPTAKPQSKGQPVYSKSKVTEMYKYFKQHGGEHPDVDKIIKAGGRTPTPELRKAVLKQLWEKAE